MGFGFTTSAAFCSDLVNVSGCGPYRSTTTYRTPNFYKHRNNMSLPRRTKIIATIGPATDSEEQLEKLILAGMNVARINMSHASHEGAKEIVDRIRDISKRVDRNVGILMDTQGPAIRTGDLSTEIDLTPGDVIALTVRGETSEEFHSVDVNYEHLCDDINVDDVVIVDNGNIKLKVLDKQQNHLRCEVLTEGVLGSRRHINLPGVRVNLPALTEKDIKDIELGIEIGVDIFAMSFVREAQDVMRLRAILDYRNAPQKIVAKLEDQQGVKNLDEIIEVADAIMVARGDLGIEVAIEDLPPIQRHIVKSCIIKGCPVIVATHMLESMIDNPMPTRAEVTDVANAVFEQADAIMLSGETSVGKYPAESVETMSKIARRIERSGGANYAELGERKSVASKLVYAASSMAKEVDADAIVIFTRDGRMAKNAAWTRSLHTKIFAFTNKELTQKQIALLWGTEPFVIDFSEDSNETVKEASRFLMKHDLVKRGSKVVFITDVRIRGKMVDTIQLEEL